MVWYNPGTWFAGTPAPAEAPADLSFITQVRELAGDLVTLEINTIIKSNMTVERMPSVPNALLDIARDYLKAFIELRSDVSRVFEHTASEDAPFRDVLVELIPLDRTDSKFFQLPDRVEFGRIFEALRWAAKNTRYEFIRGGHPVEEEDLFLLNRIENNADTIRSLLDRYPGLRQTPVTGAEIRSEQAIFTPPFRITARDMLIVKKIWEIGIEQVAVQSSIQLDGDVVTRISRQLTTNHEQADQVLTIHKQGIETGIGNWRAIADAAIAVVGGITGGVHAGRGRP